MLTRRPVGGRGHSLRILARLPIRMACPAIPKPEGFWRPFATLGFPASAWEHAANPSTVYYACPYESRAALDDALRPLAAQGRWESGFLSQLSERLFALAAQSPEPSAVADGGGG